MVALLFTKPTESAVVEPVDITFYIFNISKYNSMKFRFLDYF
jgi:hypothetical protein